MLDCDAFVADQPNIVDNDPMQSTYLSIIAAWALLFLGIAHLLFAFVKFRKPLLEATRAGFIGQFAQTETRRTAFWFAIFGVPLVLAGHTAIHAIENGDLALVRIIGYYVLFASCIGVAAFPKSPFPVSLAVAMMLLGAGYGG